VGPVYAPPCSWNFGTLLENLYTPCYNYGHIKYTEMDWACGTHGVRRNMLLGFLWGNLKEKGLVSPRHRQKCVDCMFPVQDREK